MTKIPFCLALLLCNTALGKSQEPVVATVTDLRGQVGHQRSLGKAWNDTSLDEVMFLLDLIRTGHRSTTEMRFVDRTLLALGEKTKMKITMGLFDIERAAPKVRAAIKRSQVRISSQRKRQSLTSSTAKTAPGQTMVYIDLRSGSLTLAVDSRAKFYRIKGPTSQDVVLIAPGDRIRVRIVDGRMLVEPIPETFQFTASLLFDAWDEELFGPKTGITNQPSNLSNSQVSRDQSPSGKHKNKSDPLEIPGNLNPLDDMSLTNSATAQPSGIIVDITPREENTQ